jgi:hypothetical protein
MFDTLLIVAMLYSRRLMQRDAAVMPTLSPMLSFAATARVSTRFRIGESELTYITPHRRRVIQVAVPDQRVDEIDCASDERPSDVEQRSGVACLPMPRQRKQTQNDRKRTENRKDGITHREGDTRNETSAKGLITAALFGHQGLCLGL